MAPDHAEDIILLQGVLAGQEGPTRRFVQRFHPVFLRQVRALGRQRPLPLPEEDLLQEIFCGLFRKDMAALRAWQPARGRSLATFLAWFARMQARSLRRRAARGARREVLRPMEEMAALCAAPAALAPERHAAARQHLRQLLGSLPHAEAGLVILLLCGQIATAELCQARRLSPAALHQKKHRLLRRMRSYTGAGAGA